MIVPVIFVDASIFWIFVQDAIEIDEDLIANSERSLETLVCVGMKLGVSKLKQSERRLPNLGDCVLED